MPIPVGVRRTPQRNLARRYTKKVLTLGPIAYWSMAEPSGSVALDESGNGRSGAYTGVTLGNAGVGDGRTAAGFDGATAYNNVYGAGLAGAFNGAEGTAFVWGKVSAAGIWTNGVEGRLLSIRVDNSNSIMLRKYTSNNTLRVFYIAGATGLTVDITTSTTGWFHLAVTWSKAADQVKAYFQGTQSGATQTGLGVWAGALQATGVNVGAALTTPANVFNGLEAHAAIFSRALSAAEVLSAATL